MSPSWRPPIRTWASRAWKKPTRGIRKPKDLPKRALTYLDALAEACETAIAYLSTGPEREEGFTWPGSFLDGMLG